MFKIDRQNGNFLLIQRRLTVSKTFIHNYDETTEFSLRIKVTETKLGNVLQEIILYFIQLEDCNSKRLR